MTSSFRPLYSKKKNSNDYTPLFNEGLGKMGMLEKIDSYLSKSLKSKLNEINSKMIAIEKRLNESIEKRISKIETLDIPQINKKISGLDLKSFIEVKEKLGSITKDDLKKMKDELNAVGKNNLPKMNNDINALKASVRSLEGILNTFDTIKLKLKKKP